MRIIMHVRWQNYAAARCEIYGKCNAAAINWKQDKEEAAAVARTAAARRISSKSRNQEKYWMQFYLPHTQHKAACNLQLQPQTVLRWGYRNISYSLYASVFVCVSYYAT